MKKTDIAAQVAGRASLTKAQAKSAVNAVFEVIRTLLRTATRCRSSDSAGSLDGPAGADGRNPRTGETVAIAASKAPSFKAAKALRERLR